MPSAAFKFILRFIAIIDKRAKKKRQNTIRRKKRRFIKRFLNPSAKRQAMHRSFLVAFLFLLIFFVAGKKSLKMRYVVLRYNAQSHCILPKLQKEKTANCQLFLRKCRCECNSLITGRLPKCMLLGLWWGEIHHDKENGEKNSFD